MPGHKCEEGWPTLNMNGWMGGEVAASNPCGGTPVGEPLQCSCRLMYSCCPFAAPFVFEEYLHPTAWVGQQVGTPPSSSPTAPLPPAVRMARITSGCGRLRSPTMHLARITSSYVNHLGNCVRVLVQAVDWLANASKTVPWFLKVKAMSTTSLPTGIAISTR